MSRSVRRRRSGGPLHRNEARLLRATLDTAIDAIVTIDARGLIQSANRATERMFGFTLPELIGNNVSMLMPSPYREEHDGYLARHLRTGQKRIIGAGREVQARRKDGTLFPVDVAVSEVEPRKLFTGIIRDISDRKLAEGRAREADRMATIGTLAAGLGHDMNNVLLPVRARINALNRAALPPGDRRHLDAIAKSVAYLQQLADGLHFLAMDPEREDAERGLTDLAQWWGQTGPLLAKAVPRHVRVTASIPPGLPRVKAAAHGLTQAVFNLVVNAGEAIPAGRKRRQGRVRVWAVATPDGGHVRLGVSDNGTGMTEEVRRRAFDMFFTTKPRGLGTGLGLALVRRIAERAGGRVDVETELERGTTVTLALPAVPARAPEERPVVVVTITDGRAASLIRHVAEAAGARVRVGNEPGDAAVWVAEPTPEAQGAAAAWRAAEPEGRLILFGAPAPGSEPGWRRLEAVIISDRSDFEAVRGALGRALAAPGA